MNATPQPPEHATTSYAQAGVDEEREQEAFARVMRPWLARTRVKSPMVTAITGLASGYFATLMHLPPGPPIALTTDGVGTRPRRRTTGSRSASTASPTTSTT
jgi:phosphoribosylaminoimidazole (AIR) synthetase